MPRSLRRSKLGFLGWRRLVAGSPTATAASTTAAAASAAGRSSGLLTRDLRRGASEHDLKRDPCVAGAAGTAAAPRSTSGGSVGGGALAAAGRVLPPSAARLPTPTEPVVALLPLLTPPELRLLVRGGQAGGRVRASRPGHTLGDWTEAAPLRSAQLLWGLATPGPPLSARPVRGLLLATGLALFESRVPAAGAASPVADVPVATGEALATAGGFVAIRAVRTVGAQAMGPGTPSASAAGPLGSGLAELGGALLLLLPPQEAAFSAPLVVAMAAEGTLTSDTGFSGKGSKTGGDGNAPGEAGHGGAAHGDDGPPSSTEALLFGEIRLRQLRAMKAWKRRCCMSATAGVTRKQRRASSAAAASFPLPPATVLPASDLLAASCPLVLVQEAAAFDAASKKWPASSSSSRKLLMSSVSPSRPNSASLSDSSSMISPSLRPSCLSRNSSCLRRSSLPAEARACAALKAASAPWRLAAARKDSLSRSVYNVPFTCVRTCEFGCSMKCMSVP
mmetsp:Transcript_112201/g.341438  ORF Transcript_112201/g.341438 Transcript_112201/m.341438 type:complete len:506 (-) Transcript_112201:2112-3629(-)